MTEGEWLAATDVEPLLRWAVPRGTRRQLRLYLCGGCRAIWHLLHDPASRQAVEVAERRTDGVAGLDEVDPAWKRAERPIFEAERRAGPVHRYVPAMFAQDTLHDFDHFPGPLGPDFSRAAAVDWPGRWLVDCVYGNPFRPPTIAPGWRTPTILAIAEGVYADRAFDRLPVLAGALDDAGCDAPDLLAHLRGPGPHARGCWALDRLLDMADEPPLTAPPG